MGRRAVLVIGANGSGKSSVMREIVGPNYEMRRHPIWYYSVNEGRSIVAPGKYDVPCGGCDGVKSIYSAMNIVDRLSRLYPDYDLFFEGVRLTTVFQNMVRLLLELKYAHGREVEVHYLYTSPYVSVSRVLERNGGKEIVQDAIIGAVKTALRNFRHHRRLGLYTCVAHDATTLTPQQIAEEILHGQL